MITNINELYTTFANAINQNTQALQQGFVMAMQQQQQQTAPAPTDALVQQQVQQQIAAMMPDIMKQAGIVNQVPSPILPPEPVVEDVVEDPSKPKHMLGNEQYLLQLRIDKPCTQCPFASTCTVKPSHIGAQCNVDVMKQAAVEAGEIHIKIEVDTQIMKTSFKAYKDGVFIGMVAENKENKTIRTALEKYAGQTVILSTYLRNNVAYSTFTALRAEIIGVVGKEEIPAVTFDDSIVFPGFTMPEPPQQPEEEATLDLGELVLPI